MSLDQVVNPFEPIVGLAGIGLTGGGMYVGEDGTDPEVSPQQCYWDAAGTIVAAQPIPLIGGYPARLGAPARVYTQATYSLRVRDASGVQVFYVASAGQPRLANIFNTIVAAQAANIAAGTAALELLGYHAAGDGGGALYKYATVQGPGVGKFQSLDGAWWELAPTEAWAAMFGARGDGVTDDAAALQNAIDWVIANPRPLNLRAGAAYRTTAPLLIMRSAGFAFVSCTIRSAPNSGNSTYPARIVPTFDDGPCIVIQGARGVHLEGLRLDGLNNYEVALGGNYNNLLDETLFMSGRPGARDNRYSPYAGIAIDPFSGAIGGANRYPTLTAYYVGGISWSSDITVENCFINYFAVGAIGLAVGGSNTDQVRFIRTLFNYNKIGVANCHGQMKDWVIGPGSSIYGALTAIDTITYGDQNGCTPHVIAPLNIGAVKFIFNLRGATSTAGVSGIYAEAFLSLGYFGNGLAASTTPMEIQGSHFQFYTPSVSKAVDLHASVFKPLKFTGCGFASDQTAAAFPFRILKDSGVGIHFDTCSFNMQYVDTFQVAEFCGTGDAATNLRWTNCYVADGLNSGGRSTFADRRVADSLNSLLIPPGAELVQKGSAANVYRCSPVPKSITVGAAIAIVVAGQQVTFNAPSAAIAAVMRVGDQVWSSTGVPFRQPDGTVSGAIRSAIGVITAIVGTAITCRGAPENLASGNHDLYIPMFPRLHSPGTADSNTSTLLTNVSNVSQWAVGQRIYGAVALGIPAGAYVTAVNVGANQLTISVAATATAAGGRIYDADMKFAAGADL